MSRVGKQPVPVPTNVEITLRGQVLEVKGNKGTLSHRVHDAVKVEFLEQMLRVVPMASGHAGNALAGTTRALMANMVHGVDNGFEKRLVLSGVGYRAQVKDNKLGLTLGHSHPIEYVIPKDISVETPSQTEVIVRGIDRQKVGQVAADIRSYRPPEPYKGKGVKYADEVIVRKEAKKK